MVDLFARGLQVQERLTTQVADLLDERLRPKGVGVVLEPFDGRADYDGPAFPFSLARRVEPGHEA